MRDHDVLFSVNDRDECGDLTEPGVYLHFGVTRVKVADNIAGFREFVDRLAGMIPEMEAR